MRVYGLLINEHHHILLSDECIHGKYFTKFPGGGLEQGEGTRDCLAREFREELGINIEVAEHFYTTDFYQQSAFNPSDQIISIYYLVKSARELNYPTTMERFQFSAEKLEDYKIHSRMETFRFQKIDDQLLHTVDFPIDKKVAAMLANQKR